MPAASETERSKRFFYMFLFGGAYNKGDSLDIPESVENDFFLDVTSILFPSACFRSPRRQEKQRAKRPKRLGQLDDAFLW